MLDFLFLQVVFLSIEDFQDLWEEYDLWQDFDLNFPDWDDDL